jgi:SET domain
MEVHADCGGVGPSAVAVRSFDVGENIARVTGAVVEQKTMHTIQIDDTVHYDITSEARFLAHACDPNAAIVFSEGASGEPLLYVTALRPIAANQTVTFDYASTEWDMAAPFSCACGASKCRGIISGASALTTKQRASIEHKSPFIARLCAAAAVSKDTLVDTPIAITRAKVEVTNDDLAIVAI